MDFLDALAELYPTCEAFYFQNCGKLFLAEDVRSHQIEGADRFIRFGVNVRFFNIQDTEDMDGEITVYDEDLIRSVIQYATVLSDTELRIHIKGGLEVTEQLPQYYTRRCRRK